MKRVLIWAPFRGPKLQAIAERVCCPTLGCVETGEAGERCSSCTKLYLGYNRMAVLHCLAQGEAPISAAMAFGEVLNSHDERDSRILSGAFSSWVPACHEVAVYTDYGIDDDVQAFLDVCEQKNYVDDGKTPITYRGLGAAMVPKIAERWHQGEQKRLTELDDRMMRKPKGGIQLGSLGNLGGLVGGVVAGSAFRSVIEQMAKQGDEDDEPPMQ